MQKSPSQGSTSYLIESIGLEKQNKPCIFKELMIHGAIFNSKFGLRFEFQCQILIKHKCQTRVFIFLISFFFFYDIALTTRSHSVSLLCPLFVSFFLAPSVASKASEEQVGQPQGPESCQLRHIEPAHQPHYVHNTHTHTHTLTQALTCILMQ